MTPVRRASETIGSAKSSARSTAMRPNRDLLLRLTLSTLLLTGLASCKREERTSRVPPPSADAVYSVQLSTLHPGSTQPSSTQPTTQAASAVKNHYEENAYALSEGQRL